MINKKVETVQEAQEGRHDNYVRRFWIMWNSENIAELVTKGTTDLTCISNNAE
jgi:acyl CoA:acetate/3-ketoacid CoA transferase alpha subunit